MNQDLDIEMLARTLHEAGREAVEQGKTVAHIYLGDSSRAFIEWDDLTEVVRDGRRSQARFLASRFHVTPKDPEPVKETDRHGNLFIHHIDVI